MADRSDLPAGGWDAPAADMDESLALPAFLLDPTGVLRRRWAWMVLAIVVGLVATAGAVFRSKLTYSAEATVLITSQQIPENFVRSTVQEDTMSNINAMVGKVLSHENLMRLIDSHNLLADSRADKTPQQLVALLRGRISISPRDSYGSRRGRSGSMIYAIEYSSTQPDETADVANALAGLFMEASIERRSAQARNTTAFLRRQLERDEIELRTQSQLVSAYRREHRGELPTELDTNLRRLEMLSERHQTLTTQIASKENRIVTLASLPQTGVRTQNEILLEELQRQLAQDSAVYTNEHPNVVALKERVARMEKIVAAEQTESASSQMIAAERREIALLEARLTDTQEDIDALNLRVDATPKIGEELGVLQQKEQVLRERYLDSLRKVEEAELAENLEAEQQGAQVSMLDRAHVPTSPDRPRWMLAIAGVVASVCLGLAVVILLELVDPVVVNEHQLERLSDGLCLGSMPIAT